MYVKLVHDVFKSRIVFNDEVIKHYKITKQDKIDLCIEEGILYIHPFTPEKNIPGVGIKILGKSCMYINTTSEGIRALDEGIKELIPDPFNIRIRL